METITHGPRGDIINVYSSFPWPALCVEVAKLKVDVREGQAIQADFATELLPDRKVRVNVGEK